MVLLIKANLFSKWWYFFLWELGFCCWSWSFILRISKSKHYSIHFCNALYNWFKNIIILITNYIIQAEICSNKLCSCSGLKWLITIILDYYITYHSCGLHMIMKRQNFYTIRHFYFLVRRILFHLPVFKYFLFTVSL